MHRGICGGYGFFNHKPYPCHQIYQKSAGEEARDSTTYVYGNGLTSEYQGDVAFYYHYHNLGNTMKLTDESGNEVASYTYGAYGEESY